MISFLDLIFLHRHIVYKPFKADSHEKNIRNLFLCSNDRLCSDSFFPEPCLCCPGIKSLVRKNGAGASAVYDPVRHFDPYGHDGQPDPSVRPLFGRIYRLSAPGIYVILMGFLCGFPMGARTASDFRDRQEISSEEGQYLLAFCNNLGPVYFLGFVLPLLHRKLLFPYVFGMYGVPLLYGIFLRYSVYKIGFRRKQTTLLEETMLRSFWNRPVRLPFLPCP